MNEIRSKSYNETLGDLIRKIKADTPVNDIHDGSVVLTFLEAIASNDFENSVSILNVLELLNIDTLSNNDLDAYGSNLGLDRITAKKSSGFVTIEDPSITKQSSTLYPVKPAPIAGTTVIYVNDASDWLNTGSIYIGRGTQNFEGPLTYSNIADNGTFFTINLSSALKKDHLISEEIVNGQDTTNRLVPAGTNIKIPANNLSPEVNYKLLREAIIPAGEDKVTNILITAETAGSQGNAGIKTITVFDNPPFPSAKVYNTNALTDGRDIETDLEFKDRIKSYSSTLARGTADAIIASVVGVSDSEEGKQVESAVVTEPIKVGDPSLIYVDDGSGFEPSYDGQSVDMLLSDANGSEEFLQLANFPLPRPQVVNNVEAPYELTSGMTLRVNIDGEEESVTFTNDHFNSISSAELNEVSVAINDNADTFKCRLTNQSSSLLLYPTNHEAETIKVISDGEDTDANNIFKFPVNEFSYIKLYKDGELLKEKETSASLLTVDFASWDIISSGNLIISVDNTPAQDRSFDSSDFNGASFAALTVEDYAEAFNSKFAGITATATTTNKLMIESNREGEDSSLEILGGSYYEKMFSGQEVESKGQDSDFLLNRQNGGLQISSGIETGSVISAGSDDTKGRLISQEASGAGTYSVVSDANQRPSEMVIISDAERAKVRTVNLPVNSTLTLSDEGSNVMRIMASSASGFKEVQPKDYLYLTNRGDNDGSGSGAWLDIDSCGLYKVVSKGYHLTDGVDTHIDVLNENIVVGGPYLVNDSADIQAFYSDKYPQIWKGSFTSVPAAATIEDVVNSINSNIKNVIASIYRTNFVKITSSTEEDGSIALPVSVGNAVSLFNTGNDSVVGNQSHIANKKPIKGIVSLFERTEPVSEHVWLDRFTYTDRKGSLTSGDEPGGLYGETLADTVGFIGNKVRYNNLINITTGNNKYQKRTIQRIADTTTVQTRIETPTTIMDYSIVDEYQVVKPLSISAEDNMVIILDNDSVAKTVDLSFSRTGRVNSGSQSSTFIPTSNEFSAADHDNEPGTDFGSLNVWGTEDTQTSTNFNDYSVWFQARNWYSSVGEMMIRANQFGPSGDKVRFNIEYPAIQNSESKVSHVNFPSNTAVTYSFGSESDKDIKISAGEQVQVSEVGSPADKIFKLKFLGTLTDFNSVIIEDIVSIRPDSGFNMNNTGIFSIKTVNIVDKELTIFNQYGTPTIDGVSSVRTIDCISGTTLDGKYFVINTPAQSIKFWFNLTGTTLEPAVGTTDVAHEVDDVTAIMTDIQVATYLSVHVSSVLGGTAFTSDNLSGTSNIITATTVSDGPTAASNNGTSGFTILDTVTGISGTYETINSPSAFSIFALKDTDVNTIVEKINESEMLNAVKITDGDITKATREETISVSYDHDPDYTTGKSTFVGMFDSENWVLKFQNANPNFTYKIPFVLPEAAAIINPSNPIYKMDTATNKDSVEIGEMFKLIPLTLSNLKHQLSHKALSQLEIISSVDYSDASSKVQVKSELLGSKGAIEVVGGRANNVDYSLIGDSQVEVDNSIDFLSIKIPAFPESLSVGDLVQLENNDNVKRQDRLSGDDSIDVVKITDSIYEYRYNNKITNFSEHVAFTIADVSNLHGRTGTETVWRWTHTDAGSKLFISDISIGGVSNQPHHYNSNGSILDGGTNININVSDAGSAVSALSFDVEMSGQPVQGDYITFENNNGDTVAIWFDIDGNGSVPTGATYLSASIKIKTDILSTDSPNQIVSKLISAMTTPLAGIFIFNISLGATLEYLQPGDLVSAYGILTGWDANNKAGTGGDGEVAGLPIVAVNAIDKYFDIVNPNGIAMSETFIGDNSTIAIAPTPIIKWNIKHVADSTRYKIEELSYNNLFRLSFTTGDSPDFVDCGVAVDDVLVIKGSTFKSYNSGKFRVIAVDNESVIYQSNSSKEEISDIFNFNDMGYTVNWTSNLDKLTGIASSFKNLKVGDWVKKTTDDDSFYRQVVSFDNGTGFVDTTEITLGSTYSGTTSSSLGEAYDQRDGVDSGLILRDESDIAFYEGDSVSIADTIFISATVDPNWFSPSNTGEFSVNEFGTNFDDFRPFLRVINNTGVAESNRKMNVSNSDFSIIEGDDNRFTTIKSISHIAIDDFDSEKRVVYLTPGNRSYKWNQSNSSKIESLGKVGFNTSIVTGVDGYLYYTGLMRTVQRIVDGFEPDQITYPGMKAIGSSVELLPPLKKKVKVAVNATTKDGINLSEITNEIKSSIMNYIGTLKVGEDVILSDIVVRVKNIDGVEAVTLIEPEPSVERIFINDNEKAFIDASDVSVA